MVFQMLGVEWVSPKQVVDLLACWNRRVGRNDNIIVWNAILSFLFWCNMGERNTRGFNGRENERGSMD